MPSITSSGIGSGLDINSLVTQLVAAEGQPATLRLDRQEATYQSQLSAIGVLKGGLSDFQTQIRGLLDLDDFLSASATSGNADLFAAAAAPDARPGVHSVKVVNLAQAQKLASKAFSDGTEVVGTGTLTFSFGKYDSNGNTFTSNPEKGIQSVVIDSSSATLQGIRDAVNQAGIGVSASIVDDGTGKRLVFSSKDSGAANGIKITVSDDSAGSDVDDTGLSQLAYDPTADSGSGRNLAETVAAEDAMVEVDGLTITRSGNTLSGVIEGVTLTLKKEDPAATVSLDVTRNSSQIAGKVEGFIAGFNKLKGLINNLTRFDAASGQKGALLGDATLRGIEAQIRRAIGNPVSGLSGTYPSLASIGVKSERDGTLTLDGAVLQKAIESDSDAVARLFAKSLKTTDSLVTVNTSSEESAAGEYALHITQLATQGTYSGSATAGFPLTIDDTNDRFSIRVDGISSGSIGLTHGAYQSGADLAAEIQTRISGDSTLRAAGITVSVRYVVDHLEIVSARYGSHSKVEILTVENGSASIGMNVGVGTDGVDVSGTIGGAPATGSGQTLTGSGNAAGIAVNVLGGALGERGIISFAQGVSVTLEALLTETLDSHSALTSRVEGLSDRISQIDDARETLDRRLTALEARYRAQFTALDSLLAQLQNTSTFLTQQLAALPGSRKIDS